MAIGIGLSYQTAAGTIEYAELTDWSRREHFIMKAMPRPLQFCGKFQARHTITV